jgi:DNA-binding NarL/FixJ family response regulator
MAQTVVIVDDHARFRAEATELLQAAGYRVIGSCPDGRSALATIPALRPDLVLLDVQLPDLPGFEVLAALDRLPARPAVVLISTREAADYGARLSGSGAEGFISKAELSGPALARLVGSG